MMPTPEFIDALLLEQDEAQRLRRLQQEDLLNGDGLGALLDAAEQRASVNPQQALQLAQFCENTVSRLATQSGSTDAITPRARYLRAQTYAMQGEFPTALALIESARAEYDRLDMTLDALRTTVGLMRVLGETGRYEEALIAGQAVLETLRLPEMADTQLDAGERRLLAALIHQNCGLCNELTGHYPDALNHYTAAEALYQASGNSERMADLLTNRGLVLTQLGRVTEALQVYERAFNFHQENGLTLFQGLDLINIGEVCLLLGDYMRSLQSFEEAAGRIEPLGLLAEQPVLLRQRADAYLHLNLYAEALDAYRQAENHLAQIGMLRDQALCLWGMGMALMGVRQLEEAQQRLQAAAALFRTIDHTPLLVGVMLEQAALFQLQGDLQQARLLVEEAYALAQTGNWPIQQFYTSLRLADLRFPDIAAVERLLAETQRLVTNLPLPSLRYRLNQRLGHLRMIQGDRYAAETHLLAAIDEIEQLRNNLPHERLRVSFLEDKLAVYQSLIQLYLSSGNETGIQAALAIAERAKSRALADLLAGMVKVRLPATPNQAQNEQLQLLQTQLNAIYNELLANESVDLNENNESLRASRMTFLRSRATELEQQIANLHLRQVAWEPLHSPLPQNEQINIQINAQINVRPIAEQTLSQGLPEAMQSNNPALNFVVYHLLADEVIAFIRRGGRVQVVRNLCQIEEIRTLLLQLNSQWNPLQSGHAFRAQHLAQLERTSQRTLQKLYTLIMAPLIAMMEAMENGAAQTQGAVQPDSSTSDPYKPDPYKIVIVPHRLLYGIPFHALYDGKRYLIEFCELSYAPSATVFALCQQRVAADPGSAWVLGVADARIPAVAEEVHKVSAHLQKQFPGVQSFLNEQVSRQLLTQLPNDCSVLHLACHGFFRDDNPLFSALKLADEWLTAVDVMQLSLHGGLVVLSACESGRSRGMVADEIVGLSYAFLSAGASSLLVSQWLVQDSAAAALMDSWYQRFAVEPDRAGALRFAQLEIKRQFPHPFYWAPFILIGKR